MNGRTSLITVLKAIISTKVHHHHHFLHPNIFPRGFLRHLLPTLVCRNYLANIVRYLDFKESHNMFVLEQLSILKMRCIFLISLTFLIQFVYARY